jgi:hypothetical protein
MPAADTRCRHCRIETGRRIGSRRTHLALGNGKPVCYRRLLPLMRMVPGSSVVEQPAVNRLVAGSNPARGAK